MLTVRVKTAGGSYPVLIGAGATEQLGSIIEREQGRIFVFFDAQVYVLHGPSIYRSLGRPARSLPLMSLPPGERTKSAATVGRIHDYLLAEGISRDDFVLACGGGVLSDVVGYAASTILRGVRWGVVSTTLLGMVDAAIGGKTGVNHRFGKNLIGTFWQPSFVVCDIDHLHTLDSRQIVAGMGEIVKYAGLTGDPMLASLEKLAGDRPVVSSAVLKSLITRSVRCKARIVAEDERERGRRMLLNLGHTFAHGVERAAGYGKLLHGEAVMIGLLAACELSLRSGHAKPSSLERYCSIIEQHIRYIPYRRIEPDAVWDAMSHDKKRSGARLRFVLLSAPGKPLISDAVKTADVRHALKAALRRYKETGGADAANSRG